MDAVLRFSGMLMMAVGAALAVMYGVWICEAMKALGGSDGYDVEEDHEVGSFLRMFERKAANGMTLAFAGVVVLVLSLLQ